MIRLDEIAQDIWLLRGADGRNTGVALDGATAVVIDPPSLPVELEAIEQFTAEAESKVEAIVWTYTPQGEEASLARWPEALRVTPGATSFPSKDWEIVAYGDSEPTIRGLYNKWVRVLFCGDILSEGDIPSMPMGSQAYLDGVSAVSALDVRLLVPGHGAPVRGKRAIGGRIENSRNYIYSVRRHVTSSLAAAIPLSRVLEVARDIYEDYPHLEAHLQNIRLIWEELAIKDA